MRHSFRNRMFSYFGTTSACNGQKDIHRATAYTAQTKRGAGKNKYIDSFSRMSKLKILSDDRRRDDTNGVSDTRLLQKRTPAAEDDSELTEARRRCSAATSNRSRREVCNTRRPRDEQVGCRQLYGPSATHVDVGAANVTSAGVAA